MNHQHPDSSYNDHDAQQAAIEDCYHDLLMAVPTPLLAHRPDGTILLANERCLDLLQYRQENLVNHNIELLLVSPNYAQLCADWRTLAIGQRNIREVLLRKQSTQSTVMAEFDSQKVKSPSGSVILTAVTNISRARAAEKKLEDNLRFLRDFFDTIPCPAFYKDREGIYQGCNTAFASQIIGIPAAELIGHSLFDLPEIIPHNLAQVYYQHDQQLFHQGGQQIYETQVKCADGIQRDFLFSKSTFNNSDGEVAGLCGVMIDLTQKVHAEKALISANEQLQRLSELDPLTEIANRRHFDQVLHQSWHQQRLSKTPLSLMMIDIDHFKAYNDSLGHQAGDACIREVSRILTSQLVRQVDLVARYGGEEFAVLLPETSRDSALAIGERIRRAILEQAIPHPESSTGTVLSISVGIATTIPREHQHPDQLVGLADQALYKSKRLGRNRVEEGLWIGP